ncbi:MAG: hypothetical protein ACI4TK_05315 [Agathobacter sp.]
MSFWASRVLSPFKISKKSKSELGLVVIGKGTTKEEAKNAALETAAKQIQTAFEREDKSKPNDGLHNKLAFVLSNSRVFEIVNLKTANGFIVVVLNVTIDIKELASFMSMDNALASNAENNIKIRLGVEELKRLNELSTLNELVSTIRVSMPLVYTPKLNLETYYSDDDNCMLVFNVDYCENKTTSSFIAMINDTINAVAISDEEAMAYKRIHPNMGSLVIKVNHAKPTEQGKAYYFLNDKEAMIKWKMECCQAIMDSLFDFEIIDSSGQLSTMEDVLLSTSDRICLKEQVKGTGIFSLGRSHFSFTPSDAISKLLSSCSTNDNILRLPTYVNPKTIESTIFNQYPSWFVYRIKIVVCLPTKEARMYSSFEVKNRHH